MRQKSGIIGELEINAEIYKKTYKTAAKTTRHLQFGTI